MQSDSDTGLHRRERETPPGTVSQAVGLATTGDLLVRAGRGDDVAFTEFYDRTAREAFGLVLIVLRDVAQSEEVTQEAYVQLWRTAARYDPARGAAGALLMTVARRRAIDRIRAVESATRRDTRAGRQAVTSSVADIADKIVSQLHCEELLNSVRSRPREVLILVYYLGYTVAEVADLLGIPEGTAKSRLYQALSSLRRSLVADSVATTITPRLSTRVETSPPRQRESTR